MKKMGRRYFLQGAGGVLFGLPVLESLLSRAEAAAVDNRFAIFVRCANGVAQQDGSEPERFWPGATGALSTASLTAPADPAAYRAVMELKDHASSLLLVKGTVLNTTGSGVDHEVSSAQILTAADFVRTGSDDGLAQGPSIDTRLAQLLNPPGKDPITFITSLRSQGLISYAASGQRRAATTNPFTLYTALTGTQSMSDPAMAELALARKSVNDVVREDMNTLLRRTDLSKTDRQKLQSHFDFIRDTEVAMGAVNTAALAASVGTISDYPKSGSGLTTYMSNSSNLFKVHRVQLDLCVAAIATGYSRVATLQVGDDTDDQKYIVNGTQLVDTFHWISHRVKSDTNDSAPKIANADLLHHQIDRLHLGEFRYLLDKLKAQGTSAGPLLDQGLAVWTSDLARGPTHDGRNLPFILAGSVGGKLKTGQFVNYQAGGSTAASFKPHKHLLNTMLNAFGDKKADGSRVDNFGSSAVANGYLADLLT